MGPLYADQSERTSRRPPGNMDWRARSSRRPGSSMLEGGASCCVLSCPRYVVRPSTNWKTFPKVPRDRSVNTTPGGIQAQNTEHRTNEEVPDTDARRSMTTVRPEGLIICYIESTLGSRRFRKLLWTGPNLFFCIRILVREGKLSFCGKNNFFANIKIHK